MKRLICFLLPWVFSLLLMLSLPEVTRSAPRTGRVWEPVLADLPTRIWRSPWYPLNQTLYVTTDRDLRQTTDDGETWTILFPPAPLTATMGVSSMAFDPAVPADPTLFVARNAPGATAELYRSQDGGLSWTMVFSATGQVVYDLTAARDGDGRLVVLAVGGPHIWRSQDGGDTWSPAETDLPPWADIYRIFASPTFADDGTLYLTGFGTLIRSTNGGDSWEVVAIPHVDVARHVLFSPQYASDQTLWISYFFIEGSGDADPNGVARSTDGGQTWQIVSEGLPVDYLDGWIMGLTASPDYPADASLYAVERTLRISDTTWMLYRSPGGQDRWLSQGISAATTPNGLLAARRDLFFLPTQAGLWRLRNECWEWLVNGDAERNEGWVMPVTPATAVYATDQAHSGGRSIRLGLVDRPNQVAYSSARQQVTVPATFQPPTLRFWLYAVSAAPSAPMPVRAQPSAGDAQYVLVLDENLNLLATLLRQQDDSAVWQEFTFDLGAYAGQTIWLLFGVYNDGAGEISGLYVDDVSLLACETTPAARLFLPLAMSGEPAAQQ